jgi:hypothetical protein
VVETLAANLTARLSALGLPRSPPTWPKPAAVVRFDHGVAEVDAVPISVPAFAFPNVDVTDEIALEQRTEKAD